MIFKLNLIYSSYIIEITARKGHLHDHVLTPTLCRAVSRFKGPPYADPSSSLSTAEATGPSVLPKWDRCCRTLQVQPLVRRPYSQRRTDALYRRYSSPNFCAKYLSSLAITPYEITISVGISIPRSHALLTQTPIPM